MRRQIALGTGCVLLALSSAATADAFECKDTETQPECHARLKCKANEEVDDCQKRLRSQSSARDDDGGGRDDDGGRGRDRDRARDDRDDGGRDRSDRGDRRGRDDSRSRGRRGGGRGRGGRRGGEGGGGHGFEANKVFGIGLELGAPSGFNGKVFVSPKAALDFGVGAIYGHYYYDDGLHLYGDFLYHPVSLASTPAFELPFYFGVGFRFWEFDYCFQNVCTYEGSTLGLRIPLGLAVDFNNSPLDIFFQIIPVIDFVNQDYYDRFGDRRHTGIDASMGLRFWIK